MNGIIKEQRTLQSSASRHLLEAAQSWLPPIHNANEHFTGQIFLDTNLLEGEFAAEREHEHWGLNE